LEANNPLKNNRRIAGENIWLTNTDDPVEGLRKWPVNELKPEVLETEEAVGREMLCELQKLSKERDGDIVMILLGGRGAQAMYRFLRDIAEKGDPDGLIGRLQVFTQDALAPMRMGNGFSFVRDFERILGDKFFSLVKSFTPMKTDVNDIEAELNNYLAKLESLGGIDIFFLGHGPESNAASHLCYIRPSSGAAVADVAGIIPISSTILEHHISKFKAGGSTVTASDEVECRATRYILTLGPASILGAKRIVQSVVDASTAPAKKTTFRRVLEARLSKDPKELASQLDENPGLWVRLHPSVRSLILPDVLG
jgi:6-phosphogluconolactonase/glucosamine-6-phosphate isomerase/deaminase